MTENLKKKTGACKTEKEEVKTIMKNKSELNEEELENINGGSAHFDIKISGPIGHCNDGIKDWDSIYKDMTSKGLDPTHFSKELFDAIQNQK